MKYAITGGAGTLGTALVQSLLARDKNNEVLVLSRDEHKHEKLMRQYPENERLQCVVCDIRDQGSLNDALQGVNKIIHAAALKRVNGGEYNPLEYIATNITGTANVLKACKENGIYEGVFVSTDKAVSPLNFYGATKMAAERLWLNYQMKTPEGMFSIVRYGNVLGSNGSVIQSWLSNDDQKKVSVDATRFWITLSDAVYTCLWALDRCVGGEIVINRSTALSVLDLYKAVKGDADYEPYPLGQYEKEHESLISLDEKSAGFRIGNLILLVPWDFPDTVYAWENNQLAERVNPAMQFLNSRARCELTTKDNINDLLSGI